MLARMLRIVLLLIGIGCVVQGAIGLAGNAKSTPQVLTCETLGTSGYGDNGHVTVTAFRPQLESVVVKGGDASTHWNETFVPLIPIDAPETFKFKVLLDTSSIRDQAGVARLAASEKVTGVINRLTEGPDEKTRELLQKAYPGVDLAAVYCVHENMIVITRGMGTLLVTLGAAALVGFGLLVRRG
jgi:hypothetical protein